MKSMTHSDGRRADDQPTIGAGGAIPTSVIANRDFGLVKDASVGVSQKSNTHGDVSTKSA